MAVKEPYNFSWFIVNEVAACGYPKSLQEVEWLTKQGIKHILCLSEVKRINDMYPQYNSRVKPRIK